MLKFKIGKCKCEDVSFRNIHYTKECKHCIKGYKKNVTRKVIMVVYD